VFNHQNLIWNHYHLIWRTHFFGENETFPIIISSKLNAYEEGKLLQTIKMHKNILGWTIANIKTISPLICTHIIYLKENAKPSKKIQWKLNPNMKEVVRNKIIKLLDNGIVYPIFTANG
jgi:hypothetical protein